MHEAQPTPAPKLPPQVAAAADLLLRHGFALMPQEEAVKAIGLLSGIRPELKDLQEHLDRAGFGMFRGVPLPAMTRDELLGMAAMFCQREATRTLFPLKPDGEIDPALKALRRPG